MNESRNLDLLGVSLLAISARQVISKVQLGRSISARERQVILKTQEFFEEIKSGNIFSPQQTQVKLVPGVNEVTNFLIVARAVSELASKENLSQDDISEVILPRIQKYIHVLDQIKNTPDGKVELNGSTSYLEEMRSFFRGITRLISLEIPNIPKPPLRTMPAVS